MKKTVIVVLLLLVGGYYFTVRTGQFDGPVACTQEAKLCPDGSSVGRTGPNCEFAECPGTEQSGTDKTEANGTEHITPPSEEIVPDVQTELVSYTGFALIWFQYPRNFLLEGGFSDEAVDGVSFGGAQLYSPLGIERKLELEQLVEEKGGGFGGSAPQIRVSVFSNPQALSAVEWAKSDEYEGNSNFCRIHEAGGSPPPCEVFVNDYEDVVVGGQEGIRYEWEGVGGVVTTTLIIQGKTAVLINIAPKPDDPEGDPALKAAYETLLSTFQFVDAD